MENTEKKSPSTPKKDESTEAYLVLEKRYYNEIAQGRKKVEYRDFTLYWAGRLLDHPLKTVKLNLGYTSTHMIFEIDWIGVIDKNGKEVRAFNEKGEISEEGASEDFNPTGGYIAIHLGRRIK